MYKGRLKIGGIIVLFSIIITSVFLIVLLIFQTKFSENLKLKTVDYYGVSMIDKVQAKKIMEAGEVKLTKNNLSSIHEFNSIFSDSSGVSLLFVAVVFCLFLSSSAFLLWKILCKVREQENIVILQSMDKLIESRNDISKSNSFSKAYERIELNFQNNFNDFKRLNTYLSHEQKNSISILRTKVENNEHLDYLKYIDYLTNSIDDVLTLSDNDEGNEIIDISIVSAQVCDLYKELYPKLVFHFPEEPSWVVAKERWIFRAIANVIDNAIKYGLGNKVEVEVMNQNNSAIVKISDCGIGIAENQIDNIFESNYRIKELNKNGYGIGLSLVAHVCDLCKGYVWVDSVEKKGTTFYLSFPIAKP